MHGIWLFLQTSSCVMLPVVEVVQLQFIGHFLKRQDIKLSAAALEASKNLLSVMARYQDAIGLLRQQIVENSRLLRDKGPKLLDQRELDDLGIEQKRLEVGHLTCMHHMSSMHRILAQMPAQDCPGDSDLDLTRFCACSPSLPIDMRSLIKRVTRCCNAQTSGMHGDNHLGREANPDFLLVQLAYLAI